MSGLVSNSLYLGIMFKHLLLALILYLAPFTQSALAQSSTMLSIDFADPDTSSNWFVVNDGVMGGRSFGDISIDDGAMVFQGTINTNGGGFSSIRTPVESGALANADGVLVRLKSDGRSYRLTFRTDATYYRRQIAFQAEITTEDTDDWQEVYVPFSDLYGSLFGRRVRNAVFDRAQVRSMGVIIADGIDGAFRLEVGALTAR